MTSRAPNRFTSTPPASFPSTGFMPYLVNRSPSFEVACPTLRREEVEMGTSLTGAPGGKSLRPSYHSLNKPSSWITDGRPTDSVSHAPSGPAGSAAPLGSHLI